MPNAAFGVNLQNVRELRRLSAWAIVGGYTNAAWGWMIVAPSPNPANAARSVPGEPGSSQPGWSARRWAVLVALLAACAGVVTLDGTFVYDDQHAITSSPVVQGSVGLADALVHRDFWGLPLGGAAKVSWRPMLPLAWRGLWAVGGGAPLPMRVLAMLLHIVAALAGLWLLRRLLPSATAGVAACLFALHPTHAEAIGGLVGGADIAAAAAVFAVVALVVGPRRRDELGPHWAPSSGLASGGPASYRAVALAALLIAIGCTAKESALLAVPLAVIAMITARARLARCAVFLAAAAPVVAVVLWMVARAHGGASEGALDNVIATLGGADRSVAALAIIARQSLQLFVPVGMAPDHSYAVFTSDVSGLWVQTAVGAVVLGAATVGVVRAMIAGKTTQAVLIALAAGPIVAGSNLLFIGPTEYAERLLYPATLASAAAIAHLGARFSDARRWSSATRLAAVALALAVAAASTWVHQRPWHDQRALFSAAVEVEPRSWRIRHNLGDALAHRGEVGLGLWHVLLATHLKRTAPRPIDWRVVEALELMPLPERMLTAPAALAAADACGLITAFVEDAYAKSVDVNAKAAAFAVFAQRYDCAVAASE